MGSRMYWYALRSHLHGSIAIVASRTLTRNKSKIIPRIRRKSMRTISDQGNHVVVYIKVPGSQGAGGFVCFAVPTEPAHTQLKNER